MEKEIKMELNNILSLFTAEDMRRRRDDIAHDRIKMEWVPVMEWLRCTDAGLAMAVEITRDEYGSWNATYTAVIDDICGPETLVLKSTVNEDIVIACIKGCICASPVLIARLWERHTGKKLKLIPTNDISFVSDVCYFADAQPYRVDDDTGMLPVWRASQTLRNFFSTTVKRMKENDVQ